MFCNLGPFLAGATAGYFFSKAEEQFTRYGEGMVFQVLRNLRKGRHYGGTGTNRNPDSPGDSNWDRDPKHNSVGEGGGYGFEDEEERI